MESPSDVVLVADVPGVDESHLDVTLDKNVLTIRGKSRCPSFEGYTPIRTEYGVGDFERVFTVSDDVNREGDRGHRERRRPAVETAENRSIRATQNQCRRSLREIGESGSVKEDLKIVLPKVAPAASEASKKIPVRRQN